MEVTVLNRQRALPVDGPALELFARRLAREVGDPSADRLGVCVVSDRAMREYNRRYRGENRTTDVLAFPSGGGGSPDGTRHLGDIVLSAQRAAVQAREAHHALSRELYLLLLHGYLHLLGHDHDKDGGVMERLERRLVRRLLPSRRRARR